jgi:pimeloyl-ACP methyl ester carboxylesterase
MTAQNDIAGLQDRHAGGIRYLRRPGDPKHGTLVLLHGIGSNASSFVPLMAALPEVIDVVAWNAPGYPGSAPLPVTAPQPRNYADALAAFLDELGLRRVALAGHSLGALFAASFAASHPGRVAALALLSPALGYQAAPGAAWPASLQARIDEFNAPGPEAFAASRARRLVARPEQTPQIVAAVQRAMAAVDPAGYRQAFAALAAGNLFADLAQIAAPTLIAVGAEDVVTPPEGSRRAYAQLRSAAGLHEIAGAGHACPQEAPAALAALLAHMVTEAANA